MKYRKLLLLVCCTFFSFKQTSYAATLSEADVQGFYAEYKKHMTAAGTKDILAFCDKHYSDGIEGSIVVVQTMDGQKQPPKSEIRNKQRYMELMDNADQSFQYERFDIEVSNIEKVSENIIYADVHISAAYDSSGLTESSNLVEMDCKDGFEMIDDVVKLIKTKCWAESVNTTK